MLSKIPPEERIFMTKAGFTYRPAQDGRPRWLNPLTGVVVERHDTERPEDWARNRAMAVRKSMDRLREIAECGHKARKSRGQKTHRA